MQRIVLHPLTISRTDVSPNPNPSFVVWLGPILGCILPVLAWWLIPRRLVDVRNVARFFAGLCLLANGTYIAFGLSTALAIVTLCSSTARHIGRFSLLAH